MQFKERYCFNLNQPFESASEAVNLDFTERVDKL